MGPSLPHGSSPWAAGPREGREVYGLSPLCSISFQVGRGIDLLRARSTMSGMRLLIASGADREYFPLLRDMVLSIQVHAPDLAIGILDLGLDGEQRGWLASRVEHVVRPAWDVDFPG